MSSNPEQIPKSSELNVPHGGEPVSPDASRIHPDVKAPDTVYEGFEELPPTIPERQDWEQKRTEIRNNSLSAPEKNNTKRNVFIALGATSAAIALGVGTWIGATGNGLIQKPGTLPGSDSETSAPVVPGAGEAPVATPAPVETSREIKEGLGTDTYKFLAEDGETLQSYDELVASIKVPVSEYPNTIDAQVAFYDLMEKRANYFPTEAEVRTNLNIPTEQLTLDNYRDAAKLYRSAYNGLFEVPSGKDAPLNDLHRFLENLGANTVDMQIGNYEAAHPSLPATDYKIDIEFAKTKPEITITDNFTETSLKGGKEITDFITGTYELTFTGFSPEEETVNNEKVWKFGEKVVVTEKTD